MEEFDVLQYCTDVTDVLQYCNDTIKTIELQMDDGQRDSTAIIMTNVLMGQYCTYRD